MQPLVPGSSVAGASSIEVSVSSVSKGASSIAGSVSEVVSLIIGAAAVPRTGLNPVPLGAAANVSFPEASVNVVEDLRSVLMAQQVSVSASVVNSGIEG